MATEYEFTYTPDELKAKVLQYHDAVEKRGDFPDLAGLKNYLDIEDEEYDEMVLKPEYWRWLRYAKRRRESFLNRMATTSKNATGIKMLLAQPENGGYVEKPVDRTPRKLEVTLRGMPDGDDYVDTDSADGDSTDSDGDMPEENGREDGKGTRSPDNKSRKPRKSSK